MVGEREWEQRTVAVDGAMGTGLLAVAFDLLSSTLVARSRDSAALLHRSHRGLWRGIRVIVVGRGMLFGGIRRSVFNWRGLPLASLGCACALIEGLGRGVVHGRDSRASASGRSLFSPRVREKSSQKRRATTRKGIAIGGTG
jgi:hypothetical protein